MYKVVFIDTEVSTESNTVLDYGAVVDKSTHIHTRSASVFEDFLVQHSSGSKRFLCGHNIVHHDAKYIRQQMQAAGITDLIDTLYLSPLLFPDKPYHALLKDDKLVTDSLNNPRNDAIKAMELFYDEVNAFHSLSELQKDIYVNLLGRKEEFCGFFSYLNYYPRGDISSLIKRFYYGKLCGNSDIVSIAARYPVELAYVLAMISAKDATSMIPGWVHMQYPAVSNVIRLLCNTACADGCPYCSSRLDINRRLKQIFGYDDFRKYDGENLQEKAVQAAVDNQSLLAVFPTGGGKSITFQLPALMAGELSRALTVVISPLQSLMKDQVDNLERRGIVDAVTINGLLSPIERADAIERVENGLASILYIAPESLHSRTTERLLMRRTIARFVIDEAHCFSAWGQDFRVDYLYIGDFIRELQEKKQLPQPIPVSCFTATAKQKVISDIKEYFKEKLDLDLMLYTSGAGRKNLRYEVLYKESDEEKYTTLRWLIEQKNCPTIVYVSRTKRTAELAQKLCDDGISALAFNGKMDKAEKQANQDAFISDAAQVMVATSAFGMGVDKPNIKLVIHYDISDSLENYVQEAGRAGRDQNLQAECYVLFHDGDLDKHFMLLNQTKLSISEIQQVWKAIKDLTRNRSVVQRTALEIARQAGWDETVADIETRVRTAVQALENAGYIKRGKNVPHIYATSILVKNMTEASLKIEASHKMSERERMNARRIMSMLISARSIADAQNDDAESRVDYIADRLGIERQETFKLIQILREENILANTKDLTAYILKTDTENKSLNVLKKYDAMEQFLVDQLEDGGQCINLKELNESAVSSGLKNATVNAFKTVLYYWTIKKYIKKSIENTTARTVIVPELSAGALWEQRQQCIQLAEFIVKYLFGKSREKPHSGEQELVEFSILELKTEYLRQEKSDITDKAVEDALLYLSKIDAMKLEGGFLVLYSGMQITRLELDNKIRYKADDYKSLNEYYKQKMQQIHIVGEFANMMVRNYDEALQFVNEYFQMDYKLFIAKYFKGNRKDEINRNITPEKYHQLFAELSSVQREIIDNDTSKYIVVAAGPGSGKTKVLVHKLASLMLLEDVKHEQLLMVTFSRAAATEFRRRLYDLIGNAAGFIEIKTFHSYCFDLIGRMGNLEDAGTVVQEASRMIQNGDVEIGRITKTVLVIDEAQDMDENEYRLICALMERNDDLRVIAVGDDDQNIYEFRGSSSCYFEAFLAQDNAKKYELLDNYRSAGNIVAFANQFVRHISHRMKSAPINAVKDGAAGAVELVQCASRNLEEPVAARAASVRDRGSVCILTNTNDEALRVVGLLKKKGIRAKLIQSNDGFDLYNMIELRFFMKKIMKRLETPIIPDELWEEARDRMTMVYKDSSNLALCLAILEAFALANRRKYRSDLEVFLHESGIEDFFRNDNCDVVVSTMHKSKGREFDEVIMMLDHVSSDMDERKRLLYVGMTRARKDLYIYYNNKDFDRFITGSVRARVDSTLYDRPGEILMQLSHKDVHLGFFKDKKNTIQRIPCGAKLLTSPSGLLAVQDGKAMQVVRFSKKFLEEINRYKRQGYVMESASVRYVVGWTDTSDGQEYPIILPDVYFVSRV
ncbi:MAG: RecQ family ATP-dependent DNA helicase [Lachnospiraceae bacterium]